MQQIITFINDAPAAAIYVSTAVSMMTYYGIRLFGSGLIRHFKNYGK